MRHQRARVRWVCQYPETAWCRFGPLTARSALLLVHSTANSRVNSQTCSLYSCSQHPGRSRGGSRRASPAAGHG